ncbi:hypothetical protein [Streptomyces sp. NPDC047829]|uniref:hypothetical protein n=1 Tax=Streptomyces sp. NPDC047829 TaxID=3154609 RepID=UPI00340FF4C5
MTAKMQLVRNSIQLTQGPFPYGIGCDRPEVGAHGDGKACDFFVSRVGTVASGGNRSHGDATASYAKSFSDVSYVIWRQRIWKRSEASKGWQQMADRGGVTVNHYDHVHVNVY